VSASTDVIPFELRCETVDVAGVRHSRCAQCGEVYLDARAMEAVQRAAVDRVRAVHSLMTPDEIRDLRRTHGVSQAGLEHLLGTGPKTVVRREKGAVFQCATADRLMRVLLARPEVAGILSRMHPEIARSLPDHIRKVGQASQAAAGMVQGQSMGSSPAGPD
jgi:putative zinc finger/helix-turn-helix YgiT family protein